MEAVKPLIFVHPLSPTLQKLKEVCEQNAETDGIEIYEIDDMSEFNQLFPSVGQSVCVFSDPKKCAKALQSNKKTMKYDHSKVILVCAKKMTPKTLEKFDKVGLTECIMEPVAPKTVMYKVKLHLRSIKAQSTDDQDEENSKTFGRHDTENEEEEGPLSYHQRSDKKQSDEAPSKTTRSYQEAQNSHWKGKVSKKDSSCETNDKKNKYKQEAIDTHYKGESKNTELNIDNQHHQKKTNGHGLNDDDELKDTKKPTSLEIEQESKLPFKKKDETKDELSEDQRASSDNHMDSHMKGELSQNKETKKEKPAHRAGSERREDENIRSELSKKLSDGDSAGEREKDIDLDFEKEEDKKKEKEHLSEYDDGEIKHDGKTIQENHGPLIGEQQKESKNIEKHINGPSSHRKDDQVSDNQLNNKKTEDNERASDKEGLKAKKSSGLPKNKKEDKELEDNKNDKKLSKMDEKTSKEKKARKDQEGPTDSGHIKNRKKDDLSSNKDSLTRKKEDKPEDTKRADNRSDQIKKHYKGKGNAHTAQSWDNLHQYQRRRDEDLGELKQDDPSDEQGQHNNTDAGLSYSIEPSEVRNAGELHYAQDELGDQTIDYAKLKEQFEAIDYNLKDKNKVWTEYEGQDDVKKDIVISDPNSNNSSEGAPQEEQREDQEGREGQKNQDLPYPPNSCGLEEVIKIQSLYHKKDLTYKGFLSALAKKIYEQHSGLVTFYSYRPTTKAPEVELCPFESVAPAALSKNVHAQWENLKAIKGPFWQQMKLPAWSDQNLQENELDFFYPYTESGISLGFAVVYFTQGFKSSHQGALEVLLESARGFYHQHYGQYLINDHHHSEIRNEKRGFFTNLFAKKAS